MKLLCCSRVWSFGDFKTLGALPESILSSPLLSYKSQNSILLILSWKWKWSHSVLSNSLQPHGLSPTRLLHPWDFPGKNTGVGCHFLLQGSFLIQGSNPGLPHCRQMLYHLSHQGSPNFVLDTDYKPSTPLSSAANAWAAHCLEVQFKAWKSGPTGSGTMRPVSPSAVRLSVAKWS